MDYSEPIDQDRRMAADFPTRQVAVTPRMATVARIAAVMLALGTIAAMAWTSVPQASIPAVQDTVVMGSTPETTGTPVEIRGGLGQETSPQTQVGPLIVSVVGLVASLGVVEVPASARTVEAIDRVGGLLPEANPASVNLAAPLVDGQQIVVRIEAFLVGIAESGVNVSGGSGAGAAGIISPSGSDGKVNVSTASATQLEELPGIGPVAATKVIDFHEKNGASMSIDTLEEAPGVGPTKIRALCDTVTV